MRKKALSIAVAGAFAVAALGGTALAAPPDHAGQGRCFGGIISSVAPVGGPGQHANPGIPGGLPAVYEHIGCVAD